MHAAFRERQVFRIDHYLGKETVQNILVLRFANGIFEPVWNRNFIDHVQITVAESIGVEGRGRFYEEAGALRDIVQNHMLQVLSFVAMEPPGVLRRRGGARRARQGARARCARSAADRRRARPVRPRASSTASRCRPTARRRASRRTRKTETYVAARLHIDNWRWADMPFYLRTGKRLPKRVTEVAIQFKRVPHLPFSYAAAEQLEPNVLVLRIQPERGHLAAVRREGAGDAHADPHREHGLPVRHGLLAPPAEAYETLLLDAMRGDAHELPASGRRRGVVAHRASRCSTPGGSQGGGAAPRTRPARGARRRPTSWWPATAGRWRRP